MSDERGFSAREIGLFATFILATAALGVVSYQAGHRLAGTGGAAITAPAAGATPDGQALFAANCAGCHGAQAQGGVGPGLLASAQWSLADFGKAMLDGVAPGGKNLAPVMPHFRQVGLDGSPATDAQVKALHTYLQGLK